jgi:GAF domain-containing protein
MSDDKLRDSLEDLFSDLSLPGSEGHLEASPLPPRPAEEPLSEPEEELLSSAAPSATAQLPHAVLADETSEHTSEEEGAGSTGELASSIGDLRTWREELVQKVLRALTMVGPLVLAAGCYDAYTTQDIWLIPVYLGAYAVLCLVTLWRQVSLVPRALTILGLIYTLGVLDFIEDGIGGSGRVLLVLLPSMAILLFGLREGALVLVLTLLTMAGFGWAFSTGRIVVPVEKQVVAADPIAWLSGTFVLLMAAALPLVSVGYLVPRFAATLSRIRSLTQKMEAQRARLQEQVEERTTALQEANYALRQQAIQLEASAEVGRVITSIFDVDQLLRRTMELIRERFGFYHVGIFLLDEAGEWAVLREATGEAGAQLKAQGHRLAVGETSMVGWTALHRRSRIALDVGEDAVRFANPLLPYTHSEMTLPLMVGDRLLGVLNVQSAETAAFDKDDVKVLQSMANQVAVAIENAQRVSDETLLLEATSPIYRASRRLAQATTIGEVADSIIASVAETGADGCTVVEFEYSSTGEPEDLVYRGVWRRDREPQFQPGMRLPVTEGPFPFHIVSTLWTVADVEKDEHLPQRARQIFEATGARALVNIPLRAREKVIGQVVVLRATPGPFPDTALRLYEALSNQAAVALERGQLLEEAQRRAEQEQQARQMIDRIHRAMDIEQALQITAAELSQAMSVPHVSIELSLEAPMHE